MKYLITFLLLFTVACAGPARMAQSTRDEMVIRVEWQPNRAAAEARCRAEGADASLKSITACAVTEQNLCTIVAVEPRSFYDQPRLQVLGHEAWHCFGVKHD